MKKLFKKYNKWIMAFIMLVILTTSVSLSATQSDSDVIDEVVLETTVDESEAQEAVVDESEPQETVDQEALDVSDETLEGEVESSESEDEVEVETGSSNSGIVAGVANSVLSFFSTSSSTGYETIVNEELNQETVTGYGDYQITVPSGDVSYTVTLDIIRYNGEDVLYSIANEEYIVIYTNSDGELISQSIEFKYESVWPKSPCVTIMLEDVQAGSTITVEDIVVECTTYDTQDVNNKWVKGTAYTSTELNATITSSDASEVVTIAETNPALLVVGQTVSHTSSIEGGTEGSTEEGLVEDSEETTEYYTNETTDTFTSIGGQYNLEYILSNYNVVSFEDIESTHIIGPIIAIDNARRTVGENGQESVGVDEAVGTSVSSSLVASDYSNGISSYVGRLTSSYTAGETNYITNKYENMAQSDVRFNYFYDAASSISPFAYTTLSTTQVMNAVETWLKEYVILTDVDENGEEITTTFTSPNDSGEQHLYQNDNFIDAEKLYTVLNNASKRILEQGSIEGQVSDVYTYDDSKYDGTPYSVVIKLNGVELTSAEKTERIDAYTDHGEQLVQLKINVGESWTLKVVENLYAVDLIYPVEDGYDYFTNPYLIPTTINFLGTYINSTSIDVDVDGDGTAESVTHSVFPETLVNGVQILQDSTGEYSEYGEGGNKIIWNLPNVATDSATGENRLIFTGTGQNILGHIIAPNAELWNYYETDTGLSWGGGNLNGTAIVKSFHSGIMEIHMWAYNGTKEAQSAVYDVQVSKTVDSSTPTESYTFELTYIPDEDGNKPDGLMNVGFPIYATSSAEDGTATFTDLKFNAIGVYSFIVKETIPDENTNIQYDLTEYQVDISVGLVDGNYKVTYVTMSKTVNSSGEEYYNNQAYNSYVLAFNNKTIDPDLVDVTLTKVNTDGDALEGAKFSVSEMTSETDTARPYDGYSATVTSGEGGTISIYGLERDTYYMLKETAAPDGYVISDGYWMIAVDDDGGYTVTAVGETALDSDGTGIINIEEPDNKIDITLTKSNQLAELLSNVGFRLQSVEFTDGVPTVIDNGYDGTYTSDANGEIHLAELLGGETYMLTETSTPLLHENFTGYWIIKVADDGGTYTLLEYNQDNEQVKTISNATILNTKFEFVLPETGGVGLAVLYCSGGLLMLLGVVLFRKRYSRTI